MSTREQRASALRPTSGRLCIVMACADMEEADLIGRRLLELNSACLVTYRRAEDLMYNVPTGRVALFILATADTPAATGRTLKWLRHRWPRSPITVVGDVGSGEQEIAAREGGAYYLTRPVSPEQWDSILTHALGGARSGGTSREKLTNDSRTIPKNDA